jgi:hypothetical protein
MTSVELEDFIAQVKLKFDESKRRIELDPRDIEGFYYQAQMDIMILVYNFYHNKDLERKNKAHIQLTQAQDLLKKMDADETF